MMDTPHVGYILASYLLAGVIVAGLVLLAVLDDRAQRKALARLEAQGLRRRSSGQSGDQ
jgi:heme exporter protein D